MQAIILAAGKGTRMQPLTYEIPKPMLQVHGKNLLEYKFEALPENVEEIILVVGYLGSQIRDYFGASWQGTRITYVDQSVLNGTGGAVWLCKDLIKDKFIVMMGDDIYAPEDIRKALKENLCIVVKKVEQEGRGGHMIFDEQNNLIGIEEGIHQGPFTMINTGLYILDKRIFDYELIKLKNKEEWGLPQTLVKVAQDHPIKILEGSLWVQVSRPADIEKADSMLSK